mgnify:CR=1 FL=1
MHINTQSKSDWLFNTQSIELQAYWLILINNEKATLSVKMPYYRVLRLRHKVSTTASCLEIELRNLLPNIEYWANGINKMNAVCTKYFAMTLENQWQASTIKCHWFAQWKVFSSLFAWHNSTTHILGLRISVAKSVSTFPEYWKTAVTHVVLFHIVEWVPMIQLYLWLHASD